MKRAKDIIEATNLILNLMQSTIEYKGGFISKDKDFEPYGFMRLTFWDKNFKEYNSTTIINDGSKYGTAPQIVKAINRDARCFA